MIIALAILQCSLARLGHQDTQLNELDEKSDQKDGPLSRAIGTWPNPVLPRTNPYDSDIPSVVEEMLNDAPKDALTPPGAFGMAINGPMDRSVIVDQNAWKSAFPDDHPVKDPAEGTRLEERSLQGPLDNTDPYIPAWQQNMGPGASSFEMNPPVANAPEDSIDGSYSRYFNQQHYKELDREHEVYLNSELARADVNKDGDVDHEEFNLELRDRQKRSDTDLDDLFKRAANVNNVVTAGNYKQLADTGYAPLHQSPLPISVVASNFGYWGSLAKCGDSKVATGARIKMANHVEGSDNTRVNGVELACAGDASDDGPKSSEGPLGAWTDWKSCPSGYSINGAKMRMLPYLDSQDNLGITDVVFSCQQDTLVGLEELKFDSEVIEPKEALGGWQPMQNCPVGSFVCSVQTRVGEHLEDKIGLTTAQFGCCGHALDCSVPCSADASSPECSACNAAVASQR